MVSPAGGKEGRKEHSLCASFVPDAMLSSFHTLSHLILIMTLQDKHQDCFHFMEAESLCHFSRLMDPLNGRAGMAGFL